MANTITFENYAPEIQLALDTVQRELVGAIPAVTLNMSGVERVALGQTVRSFRVPAATLVTSITPAKTAPDVADITVGDETMVMDKTAAVAFRFTGENDLLQDMGYGKSNVFRDMIAQGLRTMTNQIEADLIVEIAKGASRAYGTAGTNPFATSANALAYIQKIFDDNGTPTENRSVVIDTTAAAAFGSLAQFQQVNTNGGDELIRRGIITDKFGMMIRKSAGIGIHTSGTASGSTTDNAGYALGARTLTLASAGAGTILAGDVASFAGDSENAYVIKTGDADVSNGGSIVLNYPGLRKVMSAATKAISLAADFTTNVAFHQRAVELAIRAPKRPVMGDAGRSMVFTDPVTGLSFEAYIQGEYRQVYLELSCYYGIKVWKPENVAILLG
jgi:hypothetical protein